MTRRRVVLILTIVGVLVLIVGGTWYYVKMNEAWRQIRRINVALQAKQFDHAIELAKDYTASRPQNWQGYYYQAQGYMGLAKYEEARAQLTKARGMAPSASEVVILLSRTYSLPAERALSSDRLPSLDEAVSALATANEALDGWFKGTSKTSTPPKTGDLDVEQEKGMNFVRVAATERKKASLYEQEADVQTSAGNAENAAEREKEAIASRARMEKAQREALDLLKGVMTADPRRDAVGQVAVQLCIALNDPEALSEIRKAITGLELKDRPATTATMLAMYGLETASRDPFSEDIKKKRDETADFLEQLMKSLPESRKERVAVMLARADVALMQGQAETALDLCQRILQKDPDNRQAALVRAKGLILQGHLAQAEQELLKLKTKYPLWEDAQFVYAKAAMMCGKPEMAREALRKIVKELNPRHREALRSWTSYLLAQRMYNQAVMDARAYHDAYPADPDSVRLLVRAAYFNDQPNLARTVLEKADADYARNPDMLLAVADGWKFLGEEGKAGDAIRRAAETKAATIDDLRAVVLALIRDGRTSEAEKTLYEAKQVRPNHPVIHYLLGKIMAATQRYLQAVDEYRKAIAQDPANETYKVELAWVCFDVGDLAGAEEALQQVHQPDESAERLACEIRLIKGEASPDTDIFPVADAGLDGARYYQSIGQIDKCIQICEAELKKGNAQTEPDVRRLLGRAYLVQGKREECLAQWTKVLEARPLDPFIYQDIADAKAQSETLAQVEADLAAIPGAKRDLIDLTMGWMHDVRHEFDAAADSYGKVADRKEATEHMRNSAHVLRAQSLANAGRPDAAIAEAGKITGAGPWQRQALWVKAQLLLAAKRNSEAEGVLKDLYDEAVKAQDESVLRDLARLYGKINQADKAAGVCDEMLRQLPNDARAYALKASVLTSAGKLDEAVEWYRKAIDRQPGDFASYVNLVRIMDLQQDSASALDVLRQLGDTGEAGRAVALSESGDMYVRWGLPAQAISSYEALSTLGYGGLPRIRLALGRSFARLEMKDRARQALEGIPKYSPEYVASQQILAQLADTTDKKLEALHRLNAERPGLSSVAAQEMQVLGAEKRFGEAVAAYRRFADGLGADKPIPPEVAYLALHSMLNSGDTKSAAELCARMSAWAPQSSWRYVAILLLLPDDLDRAAKLLPPAAEADGTAALLGLAYARMAGASTKPWADRVGQMDAELARATPPSHVPPHHKILVALANGGVTEAETELAHFAGASTISRNVAVELIAYAKSASGAPPEMASLIRSTVALDLGLPMVSRACALDALKKRPECQWAVALLVQSGTDAETRRQALEILRPKDCVLARMIQAAQASDDRDWAKMAEIYRSLADVEKENTEVMAQLAAAETLVGNLEKAATIQQKIWRMTQSPLAANNIAYLTTLLWPQDKGKLAEAQTLIDAAIKADPSVPAYLDTQGWIAHLRGDDGLALRALRQAVKGMPDFIEVHAHLGVVENASGNKQLAAWHLASAIKTAERIKARGEALSSEQADGLKLAEKTLPTLDQPGK